ncbi:hypothetical protein [Carp edema virus]|nr:hypothetical protein [Carp edema virus]
MAGFFDYIKHKLRIEPRQDKLNEYYGTDIFEETKVGEYKFKRHGITRKYERHTQQYQGFLEYPPRGAKSEPQLNKIDNQDFKLEKRKTIMLDDSEFIEAIANYNKKAKEREQNRFGSKFKKAWKTSSLNKSTTKLYKTIKSKLRSEEEDNYLEEVDATILPESESVIDLIASDFNTETQNTEGIANRTINTICRSSFGDEPEFDIDEIQNKLNRGNSKKKGKTIMLSQIMYYKKSLCSVLKFESSGNNSILLYPEESHNIVEHNLVGFVLDHYAQMLAYRYDLKICFLRIPKISLEPKNYVYVDTNGFYKDKAIFKVKVTMNCLFDVNPEDFSNMKVSAYSERYSHMHPEGGVLINNSTIKEPTVSYEQYGKVKFMATEKLNFGAQKLMYLKFPVGIQLVRSPLVICDKCINNHFDFCTRTPLDVQVYITNHVPWHHVDALMNVVTSNGMDEFLGFQVRLLNLIDKTTANMPRPPCGDENFCGNIYSKSCFYFSS